VSKVLFLRRFSDPNSSFFRSGTGKMVSLRRPEARKSPFEIELSSGGISPDDSKLDWVPIIAQMFGRVITWEGTPPGTRCALGTG